MKISIVIPMYNESKIIKETAKSVYDYMGKNFDDFEIIFSNDGSKDNSKEAVESLGLPNVRVVGYDKNHGKGYALKTGMLSAEGDIIIFTDADLAYGLDVIKEAVDMMNADNSASMLVASRALHKEGYEGYTFVRKLTSKAYLKMINLFMGFKLSDSQCGFKAFRKDCAKKVFSKLETERFAFDLEVILRAQKNGYKIIELPAKVINHRESKVNVIKDSIRMIKDAIRIKKIVKNSK